MGVIPTETALERARGARVQWLRWAPVTGVAAALVVVVAKIVVLLYRESPEDDEAVEHALSAVGMTELRARPITALSGGERRRAMLGRALAQEAPVLLLDEPTTALDLKHRRAILDAFGALRGTLVFSTHDLDAAVLRRHGLERADTREISDHLPVGLSLPGAALP